ncbi:MAG: 6-carboxytetrahydropterin synthase [Lachnospira sp.]|nr:6-carboxytetrahydropterin synthase [Lachnospira sp.]
MRTYCFRTCISISHSNDGVRENAHGHTVEVAAFLRLNELLSDIRKFEDTEKLIAECLSQYQEQYLNDMQGFKGDSSIENLGEILFYSLADKLDSNNIFMEKLEIGETPLRTYIVTRTM